MISVVSSVRIPVNPFLKNFFKNLRHGTSLPNFFYEIKIGPLNQLLVCLTARKNVPWHILAPSAVACDMSLLRASTHPAEHFLCHRTKFPMTQKTWLNLPGPLFSIFVKFHSFQMPVSPFSTDPRCPRRDTELPLLHFSLAWHQ